jgi:hypothetical protein
MPGVAFEPNKLPYPVFGLSTCQKMRGLWKRVTRPIHYNGIDVFRPHLTVPLLLFGDVQTCDPPLESEGSVSYWEISLSVVNAQVLRRELSDEARIIIIGIVRADGQDYSARPRVYHIQNICIVSRA